MTNVFFPSSRINALLTGSSKSIGASCNVFSVDDTVDSIAESQYWSYQVLAYQGAPSLDFSKLRPAGSKLGTGGTASGALSFMIPFDAVVSTMRREEKKNGAGIAYLDYNHPELDRFLEYDFNAAYKAVYIPMHGTAEAEEFLRDTEKINKLAYAYDYFKCFLVKRPLDYYDTPLLTNLCTEVEIPHRGSCILGSVNLAAYDNINTFVEHFPTDFEDAATQMLSYTIQSQQKQQQTDLYCYDQANKQFGLGLFGLASVLGRFGITYEDLNNAFENLFSVTGDINQYAYNSVFLEDWQHESPPHLFVHGLAWAYAMASNAVQGKVRAAFCIQPTVSTSQRATDLGRYNVSPEIQPVIGIRHDGGVSTIFKSETKGDKQITYNPQTWTTEDVSYSSYAETSGHFQRLLNSTGLAHRHSHCFYGQKFTTDDLKALYHHPVKKEIKSLYYRLPSKVNTESLKKDQLWQEVGEGELGEFNLEYLFGNQQHGSIQCECAD